MKKRPSPPSRSVEIETNGQRYAGRYTVERRMITVYYADRQKSARISGSDEGSLARLLLSELIGEKR